MTRHPLIRMLSIPKRINRVFELLVIKYAYRGRILLGSEVHISSPVGIQIHHEGSLKVGSGSIIEKDGILNIHGTCHIGSGVYISARFLLGCSKIVTIEDNVAIGPNVVVVDTNKVYSNLTMSFSSQGGISKEIKIGANSWIGANSVILPGTVLGKHVIVWAGSVVRGTFPNYVLIGGVPAKVIRSLEE